MSVNFKLIIVWLLYSALLMMAIACNMKHDISDGNGSFDQDGMLIIEGERTFIIGAYHHPKTDAPFSTFASNGYNYVRVTDAKELEAAREAGLYTWMYTNSIHEESLEKDMARIGALVGEYKDHPALLFWEMEDEPAFTSYRVSE